MKAGGEGEGSLGSLCQLSPRGRAGFSLEIGIQDVSFPGVSSNRAAVVVQRMILRGPFHFGVRGFFSGKGGEK
jgi:hypothetical protein